MKIDQQRVDLVEQMVARYPEGLLGWRNFRMEIGGHAESCVMECGLWIHPSVNIEQLEELLNARPNFRY